MTGSKTLGKMLSSCRDSMPWAEDHSDGKEGNEEIGEEIGKEVSEEISKMSRSVRLYAHFNMSVRRGGK